MTRERKQLEGFIRRYAPDVAATARGALARLRARHIRLEDAATLDRAPVKALMAEALARADEPRRARKRTSAR